MADVDHLLHQATQAADVLKAQLREIAGDDEDVLRDTLEGEIDLKGLISEAAVQNVTDAAQVKGVADLIGQLLKRKDRIERRIAMRRVAILTAMQAGELRTVETPACTITRKAVPAKALILDEALVPAEYWRPSDPVLDKKAVLDALKEKREVPGACLSNGSETLQVRT